MVEKFVQKSYHFFDDNEEMEADEDDDPDDIAEIFKIEGNLFDYETPLCKAFNDFNYLLKIDTDLFTFDIQGIKTYEEYELNNNMTGDLEEPCSDIDGFYNGRELPGMVRVRCMTYFQDHKWYNELADGKLTVEALMHKAKVEESWGDATPDVIKLCAWLKSSFEIFHELDHDVLVKLEECWWKVNAHEITPFTRWENYGQGPYTNIKTEKTYDPYLDINRIFGRNYGANNVGDTQDCQECKEEHKKYTESFKPAHDPSICQVRRFEMIKYSFDADDEIQYGVSLGLGYSVLTTCTDLAVKKSTIWYTLKKTCVELVRAILTPRQHIFAQELKLENHPEQHIRGLSYKTLVFEKEDSNSETASSKLVKECSLNSETKDVHAIKYKMSKAKERCMAYFRSLHSHLQVLSKDDLKGTRIEYGFKRAFMSLFGQDVDTFTSTMLLNVDQLQKQLDKDEFQEDGSMAAFWVTRGSTLSEILNRPTPGKQTPKSTMHTGKALYADLVDTESIRTDSTVQDDSSRSGNDTDADDADIRPIYDESPTGLGQHSQILNETSNKTKIEKEIDALETMNIELEHSVATLRKENKTLKQHYKD
ncbi:hypothetical protein Tco_1038120, partial [Tanacetum coccineum]